MPAASSTLPAYAFSDMNALYTDAFRRSSLTMYLHFTDVTCSPKVLLKEDIAYSPIRLSP